MKIVPLEDGNSPKNAEQIRARLNREIAALGQLRNPHIVSFYDVLTIGERAVGMLMDLIEGRTLQDEIEARGGMALERALKILRQIANGLHEAHQFNLIHRDLKPENIMLERLPAGDDFVHILDFGIVHRVDDVRVTQGFLGTPLYASPEQAIGGNIDQRTDIYALGGVLCFILTGQPPFNDENVYKVLKAHVGQKPPTLAELAGREFPQPIEELLAKMLAKNPKNRPQSLAQVIEVLDSFAQRLKSVPHSPVSIGQELTEPSAPTAHESSSAEASPNNTFAPAQSGSHQPPKSGIIRRRQPSSDEIKSPDPLASLTAEEHARRLSSSVLDSSPGPELVLPPTSCAALNDNRNLFELPQYWFGNELGLGDLDPEGLRSTSKDVHWAVIDSKERLISGSSESAEISYRQLSGHSPVTMLCQNGARLLTGHSDGSVHIWLPERDGSKLIHQNAAHSPVTAAACNDTHVFLGTSSGSLYMAEVIPTPLRPPRLLPIRIQSGAPIRVLAVVDSGKAAFAVARDNGHIDIFHMSDPNRLVQRIIVDEPVDQLVFSNDYYLLAVVFEDKKVAIYQTLTGAQIVRRDDLPCHPLSIHFNAEDELIGYCKSEEKFLGWNLQRQLFSPAP